MKPVTYDEDGSPSCPFAFLRMPEFWYCVIVGLGQMLVIFLAGLAGITIQ